MQLIPLDHQRTLRVLVAVVSLLLPISAIAGMECVFAEPPFTRDQTIIGIEGWELQNKEPHPVYTDPNAATLVDSPVTNATQPKTLDLQTLVKNGRLSPHGDRFTVETQFAVAFNPDHSFNGGVYFRFNRTEANSPFHFGFHFGEGGGFYFQGAGEKVIVLPKKEILQSSPYKFAFAVDRNNSTFRLTVTSEVDKGFRYESKEIAFQQPSIAAEGKFTELFMGNNKPATVKAYIDYLKVSP